MASRWRVAGMRAARGNDHLHPEPGRLRQGTRPAEGCRHPPVLRYRAGRRPARRGDQGARRLARSGSSGHAVGTADLHDLRSRRLQADLRPSALTGGLSATAQRVLRAVAATLVADSAPDLGDQVARKIATLPQSADRAELDLLLRLFESRVVNLLLSGIPVPFTRMTPQQREHYLRGWATSLLVQRRKAFQALKRLVTVTHYTTPGVATPLGYPGPLGPPPRAPKPIRPLAIHTDTTLSCDVVIVGSGAGGGVVAAGIFPAGEVVNVVFEDLSHNQARFRQHVGGGLLALLRASRVHSLHHPGSDALQRP